MADIIVNLQAKVNLEDSVYQISPQDITKTLVVLDRQSKYLALGNNSIVVPRNQLSAVIVSYCLIIFNAGLATSVYTLKGVNGDTGIVMNTTPGYAFIPISGDFVINSSFADNLPTEFIFF